MKIGVYSVMGNNLTQIPVWWASAQAAESVHVLCVDSTDGTAKHLRQLGVKVTEIYNSQFGVSDLLNFSACCLPGDLDVCVRLMPHENMHPEWKSKIEENFQPGSGSLVCQIQQVDRMGRWQLCDTQAIHARNQTLWQGQARAELVTDLPSSRLDMTLFHTGEKPVYDVALLRRAISVEPSATNYFLLARELALTEQTQQAHELFLYHFNNFQDCVHQTGEVCKWLSILEPQEALGWLRKGVAVAAHRRENWFYLAQLYRRYYNWLDTLSVCTWGTSLHNKPGHWLVNDQAWSAQLYLWGADAAVKLNLRDQARELLQRGLDEDPNNSEIIAALQEL